MARNGLRESGPARTAQQPVVEAGGIGGLLRSSEAASSHGADQALGDDPVASLGALMGDRVGSSLGNIGTIGHGVCAPGRRRSQGVMASTFIGGNGRQAQLARGVEVDGDQVPLGAFEDHSRLRYPLPSGEAVVVRVVRSSVTCQVAPCWRCCRRWSCTVIYPGASPTRNCASTSRNGWDYRPAISPRAR